MSNEKNEETQQTRVFTEEEVTDLCDRITKSIGEILGIEDMQGFRPDGIEFLIAVRLNKGEKLNEAGESCKASSSYLLTAMGPRFLDEVCRKIEDSMGASIEQLRAQADPLKAFQAFLRHGLHGPGQHEQMAMLNDLLQSDGPSMPSFLKEMLSRDPKRLIKDRVKERIEELGCHGDCDNCTPEYRKEHHDALLKREGEEQPNVDTTTDYSSDPLDGADLTGMSDGEPTDATPEG